MGKNALVLVSPMSTREDDTTSTRETKWNRKGGGGSSRSELRNGREACQGRRRRLWPHRSRGGDRCSMSSPLGAHSRLSSGISWSGPDAFCKSAAPRKTFLGPDTRPLTPRLLLTRLTMHGAERGGGDPMDITREMGSASRRGLIGMDPGRRERTKEHSLGHQDYLVWSTLPRAREVPWARSGASPRPLHSHCSPLQVD